MAEYNDLLAIDGGTKTCNDELPSWPEYGEDEISAVSKVLSSGKVNYWTGEECRLFENEFAEFIGREYAISLCNGTLALELALYAFGIGSGDEVIVPARTFIATASSAVMCGAVPVVADVDPVSQNMSADTIKAVISDKTRAIIPVHLGGMPCDMDAIMALAAEHGLVVIEDCAQALGAGYKGRKVGGFGHAAAFSFCQDKIMSTGGEGGMLVLDDKAAWAKAWAYKDHGKDHDRVFNHEHAPGHRWLHTSFGTNWRMTEMQAAIGRIQLGKLPGWLQSRSAHAEKLQSGLVDVPGIVINHLQDGFDNAYYRFYVILDVDALKQGWDQDRVIEAINAEGVPCFHGSCSEIYREQAFSLMDQKTRPNAHLLGETSMAFLVHPTLNEESIELIIKAVEKVMSFAIA